MVNMQWISAGGDSNRYRQSMILGDPYRPRYPRHMILFLNLQ